MLLGYIGFTDERHFEGKIANQNVAEAATTLENIYTKFSYQRGNIKKVQAGWPCSFSIACTIELAMGEYLQNEVLTSSIRQK